MATITQRSGFRLKKNTALPVLRVFGDGSWLSTVHAEQDRKTRRNLVTVRVVDYTLARTGEATLYRLITTLLDRTGAPAAEPAALYAQRWEIETTLAEIWTHQRGLRLVLCSNCPWGVEQEVCGLAVRYAIRQLMYQAAVREGVDPDRLNFTPAACVRRAPPSSRPGGTFPPGGSPAH